MNPPHACLFADNATVVARSEVRVSVCLSVRLCVGYAAEQCKTDEQTEMLFGADCCAGNVRQRNHVLDGDAHWRYLANAVERFVRGGDATLYC